MRATASLLPWLFAAVLAGPGLAGAQTRVVIDADLGEHTINRHIYGHFSEHLGRDIYDGYWYRPDESSPYRLREDVIEALRAVKIPNVRWPGGCFADYYHWRDGIGPATDRPRMVNTLWGGVTEDNSFGTHEFMELVERLGAEPIVVGNVGSGSVKEMAEWWEYLNHPGGSSLADERASNGHPEPFGVRFWGVGNESWGCGGSMTADEYASQYRRFATFLRPMTRDGRAFRIAAGPYMDRRLAVEREHWGEPDEWTETLMRDAGHLIDGIDFHYYTFARLFGAESGSATDYTEQEWFVAMDLALDVNEFIEKHSVIMDRYDPEKRVWMIIGEWGIWHDAEPGTPPRFLYQQSTVRDALVAGIHLNAFNNHADRVRMANLAQTINVIQAMILTRGEQMILTPTYHVFDMFKGHQDATLLPVHVDDTGYTYDGKTIPAVTVSASRDESGVVLITLTNQDPNEGRSLAIDLRGMEASEATGRVLTSAAMQDHNTFEKPDVVAPAAFDGAHLEGSTLAVELPSKSVVALELR